MITKLRISEPEQTIYFEVGKEGLYHVSVKNNDDISIFEKNCWELVPDINFTIKSPFKIKNPEITINPSIPKIIASVDYVSNRIYINTEEHLELKIRIYDNINNKIIWRHTHNFDGSRIWFSPIEKLTDFENLLLIVKDKWGNLLNTTHLVNEKSNFFEIQKTKGLDTVKFDKEKRVFVFSVEENGVYNICALNNDEILFTVLDWELNKGVKYNLCVWSKKYLTNPRISISEFGRLGDYSSIKLKFVHIPKTAGTSIEHFGFLHKIRWGSVDKNYYEEVTLSKNLSYKNWHAPLSLLSDDFYSEYDLFCVVRNPYDRLLSAVFCGFKSKYPQTVEEFNEEIIKNIKSNENIHYRRQYDYVYKNDEKKVKWILKFENLKEEIEGLLSNYGFNTNFDIKSNKSQEKKFTISDIYPETLKLINDAYKLDFEKFNYEVINI